LRAIGGNARCTTIVCEIGYCIARSTSQRRANGLIGCSKRIAQRIRSHHVPEIIILLAIGAYGSASPTTFTTSGGKRVVLVNKPRRINLRERIIVDVAVKSAARREFIVPVGIFPMRFSG
jgi:hypothetical protein